MLNKKLLSSSITLFSRYRAIDENDIVFKNDYSEVVIPTFIDSCLFVSKDSYKATSGLNTSLGEVEVVFSLNTAITKVYRIINGQKIFFKYTDEATYKTLTLEEQYNKYFTLSNGLSFVNGIYPHSKELDISSIEIKKLEPLKFDRHSIHTIIRPTKNIVKLYAKIG